MNSDNMVSVSDLKELKLFVNTNQDIDMMNVDLLALERNEDLQTRMNKSKIKREDLIALLQAFQRLLRVIDSSTQNRFEIAFALLENSIHSALQIAAYSQAQFIEKFRSIIPESIGTVDDAKAIYGHAMTRKCQVTVAYMNRDIFFCLPQFST